MKNLAEDDRPRETKKYPRVEYRLRKDRIELYESMTNCLFENGIIGEPSFNALGRACLDNVASRYERFRAGLDQQTSKPSSFSDKEELIRQLNNAKSQLAIQEKISLIYFNTIEKLSAHNQYLSHSLTETRERSGLKSLSAFGLEIQYKTKLGDGRRENFIALDFPVFDSPTFLSETNKEL
jgi:hypothetical protein